MAVFDTWPVIAARISAWCRPYLARPGVAAYTLQSAEDRIPKRRGKWTLRPAVLFSTL